MAKAATRKKNPVVPMIEFSRSRDIPFNRIRLSDSNVREIDVESGLDELTHDIDRREDLVMGLNVRAVLDAGGAETGDFETPAGGRRYRAIARLVVAGRFPADGLVPCLVKKANAKTSAVDDSYAENVIRLALHPLDQFKAFKRMVDDGMSKEEVADAYRTTPHYIAQRLRLARVAPSLLDAYARSEMTLAMLEAFTVNPDHARQEQVWETIQRSHNRQPWYIRDLLTETTVPTDDKRAQFVGVAAYEQAGGVMLRDLFSDEDEGWLENPKLLDRLVSDKLKAIADEVAAEGWKWIEVDTDLPYGHDRGLRVLTAAFPDLTEEERATREALREEYERLEAEHADYDELPDDIDARLGEIEAALSAFEKRPAIYDAAEIVRAGVFISIDRTGKLVVARGYVRPEDEAPVTVDGEEDAVDGESGGERGTAAVQAGVQRAVITIGGEPVDADDDEDDAIKPLPERLVIELTAHRTLALHDALANNPHVAMTALLHRMVMERYHFSAPTGCMEITVSRQRFGVQGSDLSDTLSAKAIDDRFAAWKADMPTDEGALWDWIAALDEASRMALLAHCVSYGVNALYERPNPHSGSGVSQFGLDRRLSGADRIARATGFDMVADGGWALVILAFFILAIQLFVTLIEFKLATLAGFVLIPFGLFGKTAFMAERVLGNVISSGIKVLVLAVIIGIGSTLFGEFTKGFGGTTPTVDDAMAIVLAALSLLGLGIFGPGIANGLVSGGPQLGAGAAVGTGLAVGGAALAAGGAAGLAIKGGSAALSGGAAVARGGATAAGAASAAYSLGSVGQSGAAGVASGMGGVARAAGSATVSPLKRAVARASESMKSSFSDGAKGGLSVTGGSSTMGTVGGGQQDAEAASTPTAAAGGAPEWAKRMKRGQHLSHGVSAAAHAVRSGDSHGSGSSVNLSESDRS